jgi:DNA-binding transcriptional MerR regulator
MKISQLAQRTGVSAHALRYYERLGLLTPQRLANGYRDYPEAMRREVIFIAMSRGIGFSLKSIAERLPAYRTGRLGFDAMVQAMEDRIGEIDAELAGLQAQRVQVVDHIAWLREQQRKTQRAAQDRTGRKPWPKVRS